MHSGFKHLIVKYQEMENGDTHEVYSSIIFKFEFAYALYSSVTSETIFVVQDYPAICLDR